MIASMIRQARGFKVLSAAAMAAMALTFTAGCNDSAPDNGDEQQQEQDGGQQQDQEQDDG